MIHLSKNIKLLRKAKGIDQVKFAKLLSVSRTTVSNYETGVSKPDFELLDKMSSIFEVSPGDLIYKDLSLESSNHPSNGNGKEKNKVYFVKDIKASGGYLGETIEGKEKVIALHMPGLPEGSVAFEVHGNSMHPEIEEGDLVIGAPVDAEDPIKENIPYIVVTKLDGVTVKYLQDVPESEDIILVGANKDYVKPYKVTKENISKLFEVRKVLRSV